MNITGRPIYAKEGRPAPDPGYLAKVRQLPCVICEAFGEQQLSPTTAHHWIMGRGQTTKTPDCQAIPLCCGHHQGTFDTSKIAIHREPAKWREAYGEDSEYIEVTQDRVARMEGMEWTRHLPNDCDH